MAKASTSKPRDVVKARPPKSTTTDATEQAKASQKPTTDAAKSTPDAKPVIHIALAEGSALTGEQVAHMVNRFLQWKLPEAFRPDAGISFEPTYNNGTPEGGKREPSGTNLFDAGQAEQMVLHMIEGLPGVEVAAKAVASLESWATEALKAELERRGIPEGGLTPEDLRSWFPGVDRPSPFKTALEQGAELAASKGPVLDDVRQAFETGDLSAIRVRVTGPKAGRWRIGMHFTDQPHEFWVAPSRLAALEADPALKVERV